MAWPAPAECIEATPAERDLAAVPQMRGQTSPPLCGPCSPDPAQETFKAMPPLSIRGGRVRVRRVSGLATPGGPLDTAGCELGDDGQQHVKTRIFPDRVRLLYRSTLSEGPVLHAMPDCLGICRLIPS